MAKIDFKDPHGVGIEKRRTARANLLFGFILAIFGLVTNNEWDVLILLAGIGLIIRGLYLNFIYKD